jgi:acetolactate synthase-1/3 small subunit
MEQDNRESEKSLLTVVNENKPGMIGRVCSYCGTNNINIEKLVVSDFKTDQSLQKMIMYVTGNRARIDSLVDGFKTIEGIVGASNFMANLYLERELMLIKVDSSEEKIPEITQIISEYEGKTILMNRDISIFQINDKTETIDSVVREIEKFNIESLEMSKSGVIAMALQKK